MKKETKFIAIRIDAELHQKLKVQAVKEKISIQKWIEKLLIESLDVS
jgi:predicted HicB family RNase H-like nuclease